ncbi:MAG: hypothetical protein AAFX03_04505 [Pseudomonadota bacterium]
MTAPRDTHDAAKQFGSELWSRVLTRDNAHLAPAGLTKAAAGRLRRGIRALEAFVRRVLILLALELEPGLVPSTKEPSGHRRARRAARRFPRLAIFTGEGAPLDSFGFLGAAAPSPWGPGPVPARPLLVRMILIKDLLDHPEARARRLAFHMARKRPGVQLAPDLNKGLVPSRYGTEVSALYTAYGAAIVQASRARPPPLPPALRARPRIRVL